MNYFYGNNNNTINSNNNLNLSNNNINNNAINNNMYTNNKNNPLNNNNNHYTINNPMINMLYQYMNMMKLNMNNNNSINFNNNNLNNGINTNYNNPMNMFQYLPYLMNFGFNQPYSFDNVKKEQKSKPYQNNKRNFYSNNNGNSHNNNNYNHASSSINHYINSNNSNINSNNNNIINIDDDIDNENEFDLVDENPKKIMRKMTKAEKIEMSKWVEARKKLYPTRKNIELKNKLGELKVEKGLMSNLELKLRKKVNILKKLSSSKKSLKGRKHISNFNQNKFKSKINKENEKNSSCTPEQKGEINKEEKENILEDGEINEENINNEKKGKLIYEKEEKINKDSNCINENENKIIGKKRRIDNKKKNKIKKVIQTKKNGEQEKKDIIFKKGFKYKVNHLYDELIKKDKIREQNIILQAIRYLINIKDEV
jgi:hypothetical protein